MAKLGSLGPLGRHRGQGQVFDSLRRLSKFVHCFRTSVDRIGGAYRPTSPGRFCFDHRNSQHHPNDLLVSLASAVAEMGLYQRV